MDQLPFAREKGLGREHFDHRPADGLRYMTREQEDESVVREINLSLEINIIVKLTSCKPLNLKCVGKTHLWCKFLHHSWYIGSH